MKSMEAANSPRGAGEFDPREGFFPQSLMPQVERLAARENAMPADLLPPHRGNGRRAVLAIALVVLALLVALTGGAYWYGTRQAAAPEPIAAPAPASAQNAAAGAVLPSQVKAVGTAPLAPTPAPPVAATLQVQPVANAPDVPAEKSPPPPSAARVTSASRAQGNRSRGAGRSAPAQAAERLPPVEAPLPYTGGVTHTNGAAPAAAVIAAPPAVKSDTPSAPSPASGTCTPAVAALGLCTPQKTGK
jgi:hypothetical protein